MTYDTNCGEECCFVKQGFCKTDRECPFYCEVTWQVQGGEKKVRDCYPKRATMENNNLHYRITCLQSVQEETRNRLANMERLLESLILASREFLAEKKENISHNQSLNQIE